jgi:hypothetical protein
MPEIDIPRYLPPALARSDDESVLLRARYFSVLDAIWCTVLSDQPFPRRGIDQREIDGCAVLAAELLESPVSHEGIDEFKLPNRNQSLNISDLNFQDLRRSLPGAGVPHIPGERSGQGHRCGIVRCSVLSQAHGQ